MLPFSFCSAFSLLLPCHKICCRLLFSLFAISYCKRLFFFLVTLSICLLFHFFQSCLFCFHLCVDSIDNIPTRNLRIVLLINDWVFQSLQFFLLVFPYCLLFSLSTNFSLSLQSSSDCHMVDTLCWGQSRAIHR